MAFFFYNSAPGAQRHLLSGTGRAATESLLGLDAWRELVEDNPPPRRLSPQSRPLLVYGGRGVLVRTASSSINVCYELVGQVRLD